MVISSVDNKNIKYIKKLRENKYIESEKKFIVEGKHLVAEALRHGCLLTAIKLEDCKDDFDVDTIVVTSNVMKSLSSMNSIPKVIGVCSLMDEKEILGDRLIILDGIQDPGNLGTIIRSACAFSFDTVVLSNNSVKKYNEKVVRATQGMLFKTNIITRNLRDFIPFLKKKGYLVYGTNVIDGVDVKKIEKNEKTAIIMGSEGTGVSNEITKLVDKNIYIKMNKNCESLNVAVAASIIMHELGD